MPVNSFNPWILLCELLDFSLNWIRRKLWPLPSYLLLCSQYTRVKELRNPSSVDMALSRFLPRPCPCGDPELPSYPLRKEAVTLSFWWTTFDSFPTLLMYDTPFYFRGCLCDHLHCLLLKLILLYNGKEKLWSVSSWHWEKAISRVFFPALWRFPSIIGLKLFWTSGFQLSNWSSVVTSRAERGALLQPIPV